MFLTNGQFLLGRLQFTPQLVSLRFQFSATAADFPSLLLRPFAAPDFFSQRPGQPMNTF